MDDGEKNKNVANDFSRQFVTNFFNVGFIFQSVWIRCRSIFPYITDRKFMEGELRLVLCCGIVFWLIYLLSQII